MRTRRDLAVPAPFLAGNRPVLAVAGRGGAVVLSAAAVVRSRVVRDELEAQSVWLLAGAIPASRSPAPSGRARRLLPGLDPGHRRRWRPWPSSDRGPGARPGRVTGRGGPRLDEVGLVPRRERARPGGRRCSGPAVWHWSPRSRSSRSPTPASGVGGTAPPPGRWRDHRRGHLALDGGTLGQAALAVLGVGLWPRPSAR
jgi:hypothetical protein